MRYRLMAFALPIAFFLGCTSELAITVERIHVKDVDEFSSIDVQSPSQIVVQSLGAVRNYVGFLGPQAISTGATSVDGPRFPEPALPWEENVRISPSYQRLDRALAELRQAEDVAKDLAPIGDSVPDSESEEKRQQASLKRAERVKQLQAEAVDARKALRDENGNNSTVLFSRLLVTRDAAGDSAKLLNELQQEGDQLISEFRDVRSSAASQKSAQPDEFKERVKFETLKQNLTRARIYATRVASFFAGRKDADQGFKDLYFRAKSAAAGGIVGFGGFASHGVHMISPGDPNYKKVLEGEVQGSPISSAASSSMGDSTVIFVQESPTQIRVYSVDADGGKLAQNLLFISDKALQAAVKYAVP